MLKTNEILKWYYSKSDYRYTAEHLFSENTNKHFKESINSLEELIDRLPDGNNTPKKKLISDVYHLFLENYRQNNYTLSKRQIRILIWALDFQPDYGNDTILFSDKLDAAIDLITENWKDSFIIGLWSIVLKNWTNLMQYEEQYKTLVNLLVEKCSNYKNNRNDILKISTKIMLFQDFDSPSNYAKQLLENNIYLHRAHELLDLKEHIISYDYFYYVGIEYIDSIKNSIADNELVTSVYNFIRIHNSRKASMLLCAQILNQIKFTNHENIVKKETINIIADPDKKYDWQFSELNIEEQQEVEKARNKLKVLINKHFIKVFFETLVQDSRRKNYWLKFIDKIDDIKFCGNRANYYYIKNIELISSNVDSRYKITNRNQSTCALIIHSKDFVFVEFTDTGALYIYKKQNFNVNLNAIDSMEDLKTWSTDKYACKNAEQSGYIYLNEEGRITHQGYWESRFDAWMRKYYYD